VAFVVPAPDATTSADQLLDDLRAAARHSLADYKAPDRVVVVDALPSPR
jgi:acyl-coenzyme A synthetase/AMP-(fatty) acid ligase